ncbi:MAG: SDR family NAD(P)-dependent oxidoreductase [Hyphomonadaceae bacterium]
MQNKRVVITGGFGVLGRAAAAVAKEQGAHVSLIDFADPPNDPPPHDVVVANIDLTRFEDAQRAIEAVREQAGSIDALLNIAGGFAWRPIAEGDTEVWERMYGLNVKTALHAAKAALPHLIESGGAIVNVGSAAAALVQAAQGMGAYTAAKAGVHKLTESLAEELKGRVRVNAVLPSVLDTPQNRRDMPQVDPSLWVAPSDLARVMLFLASDAARAVTGALLPVTGRT